MGQEIRYSHKNISASCPAFYLTYRDMILSDDLHHCFMQTVLHGDRRYNASHFYNFSWAGVRMFQFDVLQLVQAVSELCEGSLPKTFMYMKFT
jgi:hypothetical protein